MARRKILKAPFSFGRFKKAASQGLAPDKAFAFGGTRPAQRPRAGSRPAAPAKRGKEK